MEMRNSPPDTPPVDRSDADILDDLALALRDVGVWDRALARREPGAETRVVRVQQIAQELARRGLDPAGRLAQLSVETNWRMDSLYADCLAFPDVLPLVRDHDGIRRALRCLLCQSAEMPDTKGVWLCDGCLEQVRASFAARAAVPGTVLFRTYNPEKRCRHADADTVLMALDDYDWWTSGLCVACVQEERARRDALAAA